MKEGKIDAELEHFLKSKVINREESKENELFDLFQGHVPREETLQSSCPQKSIPVLRAEIKKEIAKIIEKKTLSHFTATLQTRSKLQTEHFYKPDVDLNLYINNLKTSLEKVLALQAVKEKYVGMLSKSYQEIWKKAQHLFTQSRYSGVVQHESTFPSRQSLFTGLERIDDASLYFDEKREYQEKYGFSSRPAIISKKGQVGPGFYGFLNPFPQKSQQNIYIDESINAASPDMVNRYVCFFQDNHLNLDNMRSRLHVASQKFLENLVCNLFINPELHSEIDPTNFLSTFVYLAGNPLNELRILDILLTFAAFDSSNTKARDVFNEYFSTKLEAKDFEKSRESFLIFVGRILERYLKLTVTKRNGAEIDHFEELVEKAYSELGVQHFKSRLPCQSDKRVGKDNYLESYLEVILRSGHLNQKMEGFARLYLNLTYKKLSSDYFAGHQRMGGKILDLVKLMACIDLNSGVAQKLRGIIADCLQDNQIFINFLKLVQQEADPLFLQITSLISVVQKLHSLTKTLPVYDKKLFEESIKEINDNMSLRQNQLIVKLIFDQLFNVLEEMRYLKEKNLIDENAVAFTKIQDLVAGVLDSNNLKKLFYLLTHMIILLEKMRQADPNIVLQAKHSLHHVFELTLNVCRTVRMQKDMSEEIDQIEFKASTSLLMQKPFQRVTSRIEEEPQRIRSAGLDQNFSDLERAEDIKYDELFMKLSTKAKQLLQVVISEEYEVGSKNSLYVQFPWLMSFERKRDELYRQLQSKHSYSDIRITSN